MAVTPRLDLKQSQSLLMTQQLRQAISLLQVSNLELESIINQELEKNPLLERENDRLADSEASEQTIDDYDTLKENPYREEEDFKPDIDCDNTFDDYGSDRDGYETGNQYDWQDYAQNKNHRADSEDYDYFEQKLSSEKSLYELLDEQISANFKTPKEQIIAKRLCEFLDAAGYFRGDVEQIAATLRNSEELLRATLEGNAEIVAERLEEAHMSNASVLAYNNELSLSCVITIAYYSARRYYQMIRELPSGKGFADIAFIPLRHSDYPAMLVELKWDQDAEGAITQIKERKYAGALAEYADAGKLLLVGISYDKKNKVHHCVIERG